MTRRYDMRRRREAAAETRSRIIQAAHELLNQPEGGPLALEQIATAAGVTRATIYNRVGSRRDLLEAVFVDQGRLIEYSRVLDALVLESPHDAVETTVRESCRAWGVRSVAIRRTLALATIDAEVRDLVDYFESSRRKRLKRFVDVIRRAGALADGVGPAQTLATLALATSFPAYDLLTSDASPPTATRRLVQLALTTLAPRNDFAD